MWPDKTREELPIMPKGRYDIMLRHMPRVGTMGLDMMLRTCTIQVNLDYSSEADMVKKFRVGLALQPLATALFANSPFTEGKPNGFLSYRSHIWSDTDPAPHRHAAIRVRGRLRLRTLCRLHARCADVFRVPRRQIYRRGGQSFPRLPEGQAFGCRAKSPTISDWVDHLSTAFPEVRLKSFLEMRGADGGPWNRICALPRCGSACFTTRPRSMPRGIWSRMGHGRAREHCAHAVPKLGSMLRFLAAARLRDIAGEVLAIARGGLAARGRG
jgi:glutamate--cysteine ligase